MKRLLRRTPPLLVVVTALILYVPLLSDAEWQAGARSVVASALEARPTFESGRFLYEIITVGAATLIADAPVLALDVLSLAGVILAAVGVMQLRRAVFPDAVGFEAQLAGLALVVSGPVWLQSVAADVHTVALAVTIGAVLIAWSGHPTAAAACYLGALMTSTTTVFGLPVLWASLVERRGALWSMAWLIPWVALVVIVRPPLVEPALDTTFAPWISEAVVLTFGIGALLPLAVLGAIGDWQRSRRGRRFVAGTLLSIVFTAIAHGGAFTMGLASISILPWIAVCAGGSWSVLRRQLGRYGFGPRAALSVVLVFLCGTTWLAHRFLVSPTWAWASNYQALSRELTKSYHQPVIAGSHRDVELYELAHLDAQSLRTVRIEPPLARHQPPTTGQRAVLDARVIGEPVLLIHDGRLATHLGQGASASAGVVGDAPALDDSELGSFDGDLHLADTRIVPPRPVPGALVVAAITWDITRTLQAPPRVALSIVDGDGNARAAGTYWLGSGLVPASELTPGRRIEDRITLRLPPALEVGEYSVEVAVYDPQPGERLARDLELGTWRQRRWPVRTGATPPGLSAHSLRAATLRIGPVGRP